MEMGRHYLRPILINGGCLRIGFIQLGSIYNVGCDGAPSRRPEFLAYGPNNGWRSACRTSRFRPLRHDRIGIERVSRLIPTAHGQGGVLISFLGGIAFANSHKSGEACRIDYRVRGNDPGRLGRRAYQRCISGRSRTEVGCAGAGWALSFCSPSGISWHDDCSCGTCCCSQELAGANRCICRVSSQRNLSGEAGREGPGSQVWERVGELRGSDGIHLAIHRKGIGEHFTIPVCSRFRLKPNTRISTAQTCSALTELREQCLREQAA